MITNMQPVLRNIEKALSVRIEMLTRPATPSVIYGPDGINGSKVAYAPTPGQGRILLVSTNVILSFWNISSQVMNQ